jgi:hypothetical protein
MQDPTLRQFAAARQQTRESEAAFKMPAVFLMLALQEQQAVVDQDAFHSAMPVQITELLKQAGWYLCPLLLATAVGWEEGDAAFWSRIGIAAHTVFGLTLVDMDRGRFLCTTLHYALLLAEQHTVLLEAAIHMQQGNTSSGSGGDSTSSTVGTGSHRRSSARQRAGAAAAAAAAAKVSAHTAAVLGALGIIREVAHACKHRAGQGTDVSLAWLRHNRAVVALLQ